MVSIFIFPTITIHHLTIRERYLTKIDQSYIQPMPLADIHDDNELDVIQPSPIPDFIDDVNEEDGDIRLQTDMEQLIDAASYQENEEQEHNKIFLELRSLIMSYMKEHDSVQKIDAYDLFESLHDNYSLPLVFSQLLHLCAATQSYSLHSTSNDNLFIEKIM